MAGPGLERVWNGVWNETAHSSTALPPRSTSLSEDRQLAAAKRIPTITAQLRHSGQHLYVVQTCHRLRGGRVTSNPFLDCQLAAAKHIPTITQHSQHNHGAWAE